MFSQVFCKLQIILNDAILHVDIMMCDVTDLSQYSIVFFNISICKLKQLFLLVFGISVRYGLGQVHHTFATAGSDGAFNFWDKDSKQRLKVFSRQPKDNIYMLYIFVGFSIMLFFFLFKIYPPSCTYTRFLIEPSWLVWVSSGHSWFGD